MLYNLLFSKPGKLFSLQELAIHVNKSYSGNVSDLNDGQKMELAAKIKDKSGYGLDSGLHKPIDLIMKSKSEILKIDDKIKEIENSMDDDPTYYSTALDRLLRERLQYEKVIDEFKNDRGDSMASEYARKKSATDQALKRARDVIKKDSRLSNLYEHIIRNSRYDSTRKGYIYSPEHDLHWKTNP